MGHPPNNQKKNFQYAEIMECYLELLAQSDDGIWVESSGLSMLPYFYGRSMLHINPKMTAVQAGDIAVFHRNDTFVAHRVLASDGEGRYLMKGDSLFFPDGSVHHDELLGIVDFVRKRGKTTAVKRDTSMANLSATLGSLVVYRMRYIPSWCKFLLYFSLFIPGFIFIRMLKVFRKKGGKKEQEGV